MAWTRVNSRWNCARPRRYCARRGAHRFHRHSPGPTFAEREGSHEVRNRCLERYCVDCGLSCTLSLCFQRFDHLEIIACLMPPRGAEKLARFVQANVRFVPKADISSILKVRTQGRFKPSPEGFSESSDPEDVMA